MSKLIYLASPYSSEDKSLEAERFQTVCRCAAWLMRQGYFIFSPIAHSHPIAINGNMPTDFEFWKNYDHALIDACSEVWVVQMDGWDKSKGVAAEIEHAKQTGKPVRFIGVLDKVNQRRKSE